MRYRNLDLEAFDYRVADGVERFRVRVPASPVGEQRLADAEEVSLPRDLRERLRRVERRSLRLPEMIGLGEDLAAALFPPRARLFLERSRASLSDDEGLRIRLRLDTYTLADLPWEYAYLSRLDTPAGQKGADGFLVLNRRLSLVRYEVLGQAPGTLDPVGTAPLRMVALLANPVISGYPALRLETEQDNITKALDEVPGIQAEFYPDATVETLEDALGREAHVFHFAGHGQFVGDLGRAYGSLEGAGFIVLVGTDRGAAPFPAERLALNLADRGVRLAVMGACEAGRRDGQNAWTGVAPALIHVGIPAVVGMQYTIRDANAIAFSRRFYNALAEGQPIDAAVTDGRLAILNRGDADERDWGVPVLYLRAEEGVLFPQLSVEAAPPIVVGREPVRRLAKVSELVKDFSSLIALLGLGFSQLILNPLPSDQSLSAFILFNVLAVLVAGYCVVRMRRRKLIDRGGDSVREPAYSRRARSTAAAALILTTVIYALLMLLFHIPNTWPIRARAGAEARDANPWIRTLPGRSLVIGLNEQVGPLFVPETRFFSVGQAIHRVTIDNRSTASSPPLDLLLILQIPQGLPSRPARVFAAAVTSSAVHGWRLWGIGGLPASPEWLPYKGPCDDRPIESGWCFVHPPDRRSSWDQPAIRLPSIPPRESLEVYLELAFRRGAPVRTIPAMLVLHPAAEGKFPVNVRRKVDLNAGLSRR